MSLRPKHTCNHPGCGELTNERFCEKHKQQARQRYDANRPEWHGMYNDPRYQGARMRYLRQHPLCVECEREGRIVPATKLDHVKDHKGDYDLFWDDSNWQGLCERHHNSKTAKEHNNAK